ncbi:hypothetical protein EV361DRAFT_956605 [Lentinula raphanica]|nr:hypothetical protein F5880DRAFT_1619211 [Lentinula raphanica]KAJ3963798.1 hypothetical protein EV361DRAFT_956605 [Lentinula raphanica]
MFSKIGTMRFSFTTNTCLVLLALLPPLTHAMPTKNQLNSNSVDNLNFEITYEVGTILLQPRDYHSRAARDAAHSFAISTDEIGGRLPGFIGPRVINIEEDHDFPISTQLDFGSRGSPFHGPLIGFRFVWDFVADNLPPKPDVYEVWVTSELQPDRKYYCAKLQLIASGEEYMGSLTPFKPVEPKPELPTYTDSEETVHAAPGN